MTLRLTDLVVRFGEAAGLEPISLEVRRGERLALVGASGAGKTSLLRAVAGLAPVAGGRVEIGGRDVTRLPAERRDAVYLHQTPLLFPHLDVFENVAFPLRVRRVGEREVRERVEALLEAVRLPDYGPRAARTLSGGQRHRVALARAVAARPALLLLDEPLSALDAALREEVRGALDALLRERETALVLVTHDLDEAAALADTMGVIVDRRLEQLDSPDELFARPATLAVARFLSLPNQLPGLSDRGTVRTALGPLPLPTRVCGPVVAVFRPDALRFDVDGPIRGVVLGIRHRVSGSTAMVGVGDAELEVSIDGADPPPAGAEITLRLRPDRVLIYPAAAG